LPVGKKVLAKTISVHAAILRMYNYPLSCC
jgi:hypothetical protein